MILSVSRRTDIPNYYAEWFYQRMKEGVLYVRNPMNAHQVSKIDVSPETVDCIVFWSKNPEPMMGRLEELKDYKYYFQISLTGYGKEIEPFVPHKKEEMIPVFQKLSRKIGKEKVVWRYDPILFTETYSEDYHLKAFGEIAANLRWYCERVVISFLDLYTKIRKNMKGLGIAEKEGDELFQFAAKLANIAKENEMQIVTCAETIDLSSCGIEHSSCIDKELIEKIIGSKIKADKDKNQRKECGCIESIDIGTYNTCLNGCKYCYANFSHDRVKENAALYNAASPILCGSIKLEDNIIERKVKSIKTEQLTLFDPF